ncbi:Villin-1 [Entophlyctis sp. JEL0112]|nr:Villin-1 [Entophlyctis sp. JEL0112]
MAAVSSGSSSLKALRSFTRGESESTKLAGEIEKELSHFQEDLTKLKAYLSSCIRANLSNSLKSLECLSLGSSSSSLGTLSGSDFAHALGTEPSVEEQRRSLKLDFERLHAFQEQRRESRLARRMRASRTAAAAQRLSSASDATVATSPEGEEQANANRADVALQQHYAHMDVAAAGTDFAIPVDVARMFSAAAVPLARDLDHAIVSPQSLSIHVWSTCMDGAAEDLAATGVAYSAECLIVVCDRLQEVYVWVGDDASELDRNAALALARTSAPESCGDAAGCTAVITQGHEPCRFLQIFTSRVSDRGMPAPMIVRRGRRVKTNSHGVCGAEKVLFCIGGYSPAQTRAVQVAWNVQSFSSAVVMLAVSKDSGMLWIGDGAHGFEREAGINAARRLCVDFNEVQELCEPSDFWKQFGVEKSQSPRSLYASVPYLLQKAKFTNNFVRKLWRITKVNGETTSNLVFPFTQRDLDEHGVFILDAFFEVFVWVGRYALLSGDEEISAAMAIALDYCKYCELHQKIRLEYELKRNEVRAWLVQDGHETLEFKSCFLSFDDGTKDLGSSASFRFFNSLLEASNGRYSASNKPKAVYIKNILETGKIAVRAIADALSAAIGALFHARLPLPASSRCLADAVEAQHRAIRTVSLIVHSADDEERQLRIWWTSHEPALRVAIQPFADALRLFNLSNDSSVDLSTRIAAVDKLRALRVKVDGISVPIVDVASAEDRVYWRKRDWYAEKLANAVAEKTRAEDVILLSANTSTSSSTRTGNPRKSYVEESIDDDDSLPTKPSSKIEYSSQNERGTKIINNNNNINNQEDILMQIALEESLKRHTVSDTIPVEPSKRQKTDVHENTSTHPVIDLSEEYPTNATIMSRQVLLDFEEKGKGPAVFQHRSSAFSIDSILHQRKNRISMPEPPADADVESFGGYEG